MAQITKKKQGLLYSVVEFSFLLLVVFLIRTFIFGLYQVPTGSMETTLLVGERFFADKLSYWVREPRRGEILSFNEWDYKYSSNPFKQLFERYAWGPRNFTKRVIGIPGDEIIGSIEEGKPVLYVNGSKLEEPYLNKYPLVYVWEKDPQQARLQAEKEFHKLTFGTEQDPEIAERLIAQKMLEMVGVHPKTIDPNKPFDQQPFYRINPLHIFPKLSDHLQLLMPGTPLPPKPGGQEKVDQKQNYWDGSDVFYIKLAADEVWGMGDNRLGSKDCRSFGPIKLSSIHGRIVFRIWSIDSDESWWIVDLIKNPIDFFKRVRWGRFLQWV